MITSSLPTDTSRCLTLVSPDHPQTQTSEQADPSTPSFHDVLQKEGGDTARTSTLKDQAPANTDQAQTSATPGEPPSEPTVDGKTSESISKPIPTLTTDKNKAPLPHVASNLLGLIAQSTVLAENVKKGSGVNSSALINAKPGKLAPPDSGSAKNSVAPIPAGLDLSTAMTQVSLLSAMAQQPAAGKASGGSLANGAGKDFPLTTLGQGGVGSLSKEKKSATAHGEGSFLQAGNVSGESSASPLGMLNSLLGNAGQLSQNQQLTPDGNSKVGSLTGLDKSALSINGTANVDKDKAMSAGLNFPQIISGNGANVLPQEDHPEVKIVLGSNHDFDNALKHVMQIADLTQTSESRTPMRVAIEIQTPPGAIVNVYVSRQNDQWRAQLSTNDPQALTWVQNKMDSLPQSSELGVEVRWLPPQVESNSGSGSEPNFGWDRGGQQGQNGYQQPDERHQPHRQPQNKDELTEIASIQSHEFMNTLISARRAA